MTNHHNHQFVVWVREEDNRVSHVLCECGKTATLIYKGIREAPEYIPGVDDDGRDEQ